MGLATVAATGAYSDLTGKPDLSGYLTTVTSSQVTTALGYTPADQALIGANSGIAQLDAGGKVPSAQLPNSDSVSEGSANLYFTNARARAAISATGSLSYDSATGVLSYTAPTINALVPSQTGNTGKFLTTDGTSVSWASVDALPTQTGNAGKYLKTDGTTASWADVTAGATGGGTNKIFYLNDQTITADYTIAADQNASSTGPITIADGVTVTVSDGANWVVH